MNKEFEKYLIIFLLLLLLGLGACANKKLSGTAGDPAKPATDTITDSVGKMESIADALGCMFAPETCKQNK